LLKTPQTAFHIWRFDDNPYFRYLDWRDCISSSRQLGFRYNVFFGNIFWIFFCNFPAITWSV
jgi:hypothetical protein